MKRFLLFFIMILVVFSMFNCESRRYQFVAKLAKVNIYEIDNTGAFYQEKKITASEINRLLNLPEEAKIIRVDIESVSIIPAIKTGNQTKELVLSGYTFEGSETKKPLFENKSINFKTGVDIGYGVRVPIETLVSLGVDKLKTKINKYVKRLDDLDMVVAISGDTVPANQRTVMDIGLWIEATVVYEQCLNVVWFFGGEKCEDAVTK